MIRLGDLDRWIALMPGQVMDIGTAGEPPRRIKLTIRAPALGTIWYQTEPDGPREFLATVDRFDEVEFTAGGNVGISTDDEEVLLLCSETEVVFREAPEAEVFTTLADRKARNPDLERLMFLQQQNMERRFQALAMQMQGHIDERAATLGRTRDAEQFRESTARTQPKNEPSPTGTTAPSGSKEAVKTAPTGANESR